MRVFVFIERNTLMPIKSSILMLLSSVILGICQAEEPRFQTHITRGDDQIAYSGGKEGLRTILIAFLKVSSVDPVKIRSGFQKEVRAKDQELTLEMKSRTHSFEIVNGYHRFTVLPDDPKDKVFAIIADASYEGAVNRFVDSLYKLAK